MSPGRPRSRRISDRYRRHLVAIARIFLARGRNAAATVRDVRRTLGLDHFAAARLDAWRHHPEWQAALDQARMLHAADADLPPDVRGAKLIRFAKQRLEILEDLARQAAENREEPEPELLKELRTWHEALRAEERHQEAIKRSRAQRNMRLFVINLMNAFKGFHLPPEIARELERLKRHPLELMEGVE